MANKKQDLKLPKRNYLDVISAQLEPMWDKIKNNTFVNMVLPIQDLSEGNTQALLPAIIPGGQAVKTTAKAMTKPLHAISFKTATQGKPLSNINPNTGKPITMQDIVEAIAHNGRTVYEGTSEAAIKSKAIMDQASKQASYKAIIESQAKKDARKVDIKRPRRQYTKHQVEELGSKDNPLLTSQIDVAREFKVDPRKTMEGNWNKFIKEMQEKFRFTKKEAEKIFNNNFSQYFKKQGGTINYLNIFK